MELIKQQLKAFSGNARARQSFNLLLTNFIGIPLGIITSIILSKTLGAEDFGNYSFIVSLFTFAVLLATFGFYQAGNRALVLNHNKKRARQYYGAVLIITCVLFALMTLCLVVYSFVDSNLVEKGLTTTFIYALPLGFVFLATKYIETLLQADNRIGLLSTYRLLTKVVYLFILLVIWHCSFAFQGSTLLTILYGYFIAQLSVFLCVLLFLKPSFLSVGKRAKELWLYNKNFGLNIYIGSVFAVGFTSLSQILIGYFSNSNSGVGFYALALTFAAPLALIPNTIATTHYKDFAKAKNISKKLLGITLAISVSALLVLWVILTPFISYFYGEEFLPVVDLNYIVSLGVLVHGFADFFNRFLGANGQSIALRNSSFVVGGGAMLLGIVFIPLLGEHGAAITKLTVGFIYLGIILWYYFNFTKRNYEK